MRHIDEARLEVDLAYRFGYAAEFMGFGPDDVAAELEVCATAPDGGFGLEGAAGPFLRTQLADGYGQPGFTSVSARS